MERDKNLLLSINNALPFLAIKPSWTLFNESPSSTNFRLDIGSVPSKKIGLSLPARLLESIIFKAIGPYYTNNPGEIEII
jgi:hypothetical protein